MRVLTNRTDDRTQEWGSGKYTRCQTSVGCGKHVCDDTASIGQRRRAERASQESQNDQSLDVLRASRACVEDSEEHVGAEEEVLATVQF